METTKICIMCNTQKEINQFSKNGKNYTRSYCKNCSKIKYNEWHIKNKEKKEQYRKEYEEKNKEKILERYREYHLKNKEKRNKQTREYFKTEKGIAIMKNSNHKRRIIKKQGTATTEEIKHLINNIKNCYWCNSKIIDNKYNLDHYVPLSRGGKHTIDNLVISCEKCNKQKHAKDPYQFAQERGRLL